MKQGFKSLSELAAAIQSNDAGKADYVVPARAVQLLNPERILVGDMELGLSNTGHRQLAQFTDIPQQYYDRMKQAAPELLTANVNKWLAERGEDRRMVRALHGNVRALLSDRYQRIDNKEVAEVVLNVLADIPQLQVVSSEITEHRMYIKATSRAITAPDPGKRRVGALVEAGVMATNSEIGSGSVSIKPFANFLICTNGMVRDDGSMRATHVGRRVDADIEGLLSDSTKRLEDEVVLRKVRDVVAHAFDEVAFQKFMGKLVETTERKMTSKHVVQSIEVLGRTIGLSAGERESVLTHLVDGGDLSQYGLANAVTRTAEDSGTYDRATELETLGYRVITLPASAWREVAEAKA